MSQTCPKCRSEVEAGDVFECGSVAFCDGFEQSPTCRIRELERQLAAATAENQLLSITPVMDAEKEIERLREELAAVTAGCHLSHDKAFALIEQAKNANESLDVIEAFVRDFEQTAFNSFYVHGDDAAAWRARCAAEWGQEMFDVVARGRKLLSAAGRTVLDPDPPRRRWERATCIKNGR